MAAEGRAEIHFGREHPIRRAALAQKLSRFDEFYLGDAQSREHRLNEGQSVRRVQTKVSDGKVKSLGCETEGTGRIGTVLGAVAMWSTAAVTGRKRLGICRSNMCPFPQGAMHGAQPERADPHKKSSQRDPSPHTPHTRWPTVHTKTVRQRSNGVKCPLIIRNKLSTRTLAACAGY